MQPQNQIPTKAHTPEETVIEATKQLIEARKHIEALYYARWALFTRPELYILDSALTGLICLSNSTPSLNTPSLHRMLESLQLFIKDHDRMRDSVHSLINDHPLR